MIKITRVLIRHRKTVLILGTVLTLFFGINLFNLRIDGSFTNVLPATDPDFLFNLSVEEDFGSSDEVIILLKDERGIYSRETIALIEEFTAELSAIDEIEGNRIANLVTISGFVPPSLESEWPVVLADLEEFMKTDPLAQGTLVNEDGTSTIITAPVSSEVGLSEEKLKTLVGAVKSIADTLREKYPDRQILLSGHPVVNAEIMEKMANDLYLLFPVAVIATALMLLIILRSLRGMLIPLIITIISVVWTFGLKGLLDSPLTITETVIPVILISISCADGIHIISEAFHYMHHGKSAEAAILRTNSELWKPVMLTSVTTALGFGSFVFSSGRSLRNMGLFLAFGVMTAMVFSLFFIPVLFSWYKPYRPHADRSHYRRQYNLLKKIERITEFFLKHRLAVISAAVVMLAAAGWGMMNINTDTDEIRYFRQDNPVRRTAELIEEEMGGLSTLQIVLEGEEGAFRSAGVLTAMAELQTRLEEESTVSSALSLADTVAYMYYSMRGRSPGSFMIPENSNFVDRLLILMTSGGDERAGMLDTFVTRDFSRARILVRINDSNTKVMERLIADIDPSLAPLMDLGLSIGFAGDYIRLSNGRVIVESQVLSLCVTLGIILLILSLLYRSVISGLMVSLPVITAVLFNFAVMWLFGVSLNPATAIIAAVGLGVGIDYSIHIFARFSLLRSRGDSFQSSLVNAVTESARGILSNALSVGLGFLILLLSVYRIINDMGWIIALTMLTTSLASLILLPCLLSLRRKGSGSLSRDP